LSGRGSGIFSTSSSSSRSSNSLPPSDNAAPDEVLRRDVLVPHTASASWQSIPEFRKPRAATMLDTPWGGTERMECLVGAYTREERKARVARFLEKRKVRQWVRKCQYGVRKDFADSRVRVKGRFVKKDEESAIEAATANASSGRNGKAQSKTR